MRGAPLWHRSKPPRVHHTPLVMCHGLSLSLIRGRGDAVKRFILQVPTLCGFANRTHENSPI
jgi:hypothetical protein